MLTYRGLEALPWNRLLASRHYPWQPPVTAHLPIQPVHSPHFVHVDSALSVCRRSLASGARVDARCEGIEQRQTWSLQVALDEPAFVPDFRYGRLSLAEGQFPVVHAGTFSPGRRIAYAFDYSCTAIDGLRQALVWVSGRIVNEGPRPTTASVWLRLYAGLEQEFFEYHYLPFRWDASFWKPCDRTSWHDGELRLDGRPMARVDAGGCACRWHEQFDFTRGNYPKQPAYNGFYTHPSRRLDRLDHAVQLSAELAPGESASFGVALLVNPETATAADVARLRTADGADDRAAALAHFQAALGPAVTRLVFPTEQWEEIFRALQVSTLQLLARFDDQPGLVPTQGGSSERDYVWVWEAGFMLLPLLQLGHFGPVREALEFIYSMQDGGTPPAGRLTSTAGSVGTTGPRWLNTTGMALTVATSYYRYSRDEAFLAEYLPKLLRAGDWILGEIRATRCPAADGSRPVWYGLMPFGHATDGDVGYVVAFTDAYCYQGLHELALLLGRIDHPRAAEVAAEAATYRADILAAVEHLARPDGYIDRRIPTGDPQEVVFVGADNTCGAHALVTTGVLDPGSPRCRAFTAWFEREAAEGIFLGAMDREIAYLGISELVWQEIYLGQGEWKKAFLAMDANRRYGMSQDTFQVQERFHRADPAFTPWQPNGGGNGRLLKMILNALYFEQGDGATLCGGVPREWLEWNGITRIEGLYTTGGRVDLEVRAEAHCLRLILTGDCPAALPARLRLPEHLTGEPAPRWLAIEPGSSRVELACQGETP